MFACFSQEPSSKATKNIYNKTWDMIKGKTQNHFVQRKPKRVRKKIITKKGGKEKSNPPRPKNPRKTQNHFVFERKLNYWGKKPKANHPKRRSHFDNASLLCAQEALELANEEISSGLWEAEGGKRPKKSRGSAEDCGSLPGFLRFHSCLLKSKMAPDSGFIYVCSEVEIRPILSLGLLRLMLENNLLSARRKFVWFQQQPLGG